jgi:hypothetical protein
MKIRISILLLILVVSGVWSRNGDGGYAGAFLRMAYGARAQALGDAYSSIPEGAISGMYNPALLPHLAHRQLALAYGYLPLDRRTSYIGFAMPLQPHRDEGGQLLKAGFSLAWLRAGVNNIDGRDMSGNHVGMFSNSEDAFYFSFAMAPVSMFSIGISAKVLYNRMPNMTNDDAALTSRGFGIDIGGYLSPMENLSLGVVLRDNNSKYTWNTDKVWERGTSTTYKFPRVLRVAASYRLPKWLLVTAELEDSKEQSPRFHAGAEFSYQDIGSLQLGMDDLRPCFGLGFGAFLFNRRTMLNYAYVFPDEGPGADHVFTWCFEF